MTAAAVDLADEGRKLAGFDWLVFGRRSALHGPTDLTDVQAEELWDGAQDVTFLCGRRASGVVIPSLCERMGLLRCGQCADRAKYPRGVGAPKNDATIRQREGWDS